MCFNKKMILLFGLVVLITSFIKLHAQTEEELLKNKLEPFIEKAIKEFDVPGLSVGIVKDGKIIYIKGFGIANVETGKKVNPETMFMMASVTKVFTATAVMQLVEKGRIRLDNPLIKHLPYFKLNDKRYKAITIRHLLTHSSGVPSMYKDNFGYRNPEFDDGALERYIRDLANREMEFDPGEEFSYSNHGYAILAALISEVAGETYENYMRRNILDPLGMKRSTFVFDEVDKENIAAPHILGSDFGSGVNSYYPVNRWDAGVSGLWSNATDMCRWALANLNGGELNCKRILKKSSLDTMWKKAGEKYGNIGLGWFIYNFRDNKMITHTGLNFYKIDFCLIPEHSLGVVVMCNIERDLAWPIAGNAMRLLLGYEPRELRVLIDIQLINKIRSDGIDSAVQLYHNLRKELPENRFGARQLPMLGLRISDSANKDKLEIAEKILKLAIEYYPDYSYSYDFLAEIYTLMALKNYQKAVELDSTNEGAMRIIEILSSLKN